MTVHHVFPYDPGHLGVSLSQWWTGQRTRWPLAALEFSGPSEDTIVHVISRSSARERNKRLTLWVHGTLYDNVKWHAWGDDWSMSLAKALWQTTADDIVVVHLEGYAAARLSMRFAAAARRILVLHGRGVGAAEDHVAADKIVVLRDEARQTLLQSGVDAQKIVQMTPSVDREVFSPNGKTIGPGRRTIGYVGRLEASKGVFELADVMRQLSDLPVRLRLIGSAPSGKDYDTAEHVFRGLPVDIVGEVGTADVAAELRTWNALVLPSYTEGLSIAALEALACGVPVVSVEGVLPGNFTCHDGSLAVSRDALAEGIRRAMELDGQWSSAWIPSHKEAGKAWDQLYASLPLEPSRNIPSLRPLLGRLKRVQPARPPRGSSDAS